MPPRQNESLRIRHSATSNFINPATSAGTSGATGKPSAVVNTPFSDGSKPSAPSTANATSGSNYPQTRARFPAQYPGGEIIPLGSGDAFNGTGGQFDAAEYLSQGNWGTGSIGLSSANTWGYNGTGPGLIPTPSPSTRPTNTASGAGVLTGRTSQQAGQSSSFNGK